MAGEIIINGIRQLETKLQRMSAEIERNKRHAARSAANMVRRAMRREAPKATGKLRRNIRVLPVPGGYVVKPTGRVAHLVIKGTKPHPIGLKQAHALHFTIAGGSVFVHSAEHPGAKANPFVARTRDLATTTEAVIAAKETLLHGAPVPDE